MICVERIRKSIKKQPKFLIQSSSLKMAAAFNPVVGSLVWVEDPEVVWTDGEVMEVNIEKIMVLCTSGKMVSVKASNVHSKEAEASPCGVDDMTKLAYLHEPGVLQNLRSRYDMDKIYTYTGNILIAVNPFKKLPNLYGKHIMELYKGANFGELSPHPFAIADAAYRRMINGGKSQSVLVSGESGAGKTETAKQIMHYLAYMGGRAVEQRVVESNPVLEAFGNAKTVRNNNSSRFGKFVQIQFDQRGRTLGAAIKTYLLETSRICHVSDKERNYHCFYMLCAAPPEDVTRYKLGHPSSFHYLNQSECYELDGVDDSEQYLATRRAMATVGISSEEQDAIFRVVAAILHLGNIEFANGEEIDSSQVKDKKSWFHLRTAAELLRCDAKALEDSLCKHVILTPNEPITKWLDPHSAVVSRDTLAKIVYSRLFDWLVCKINSSIGQDYDSKFLIGVLDIYGFESFKTNSFEQFCINLTNEKLQQHFNQHVFKMEQEKYTKEEIDWSNIDFVDNQDVLDLIENKPGGIIALLDEACMFPRSTHETFSYKLRQKFKNHKCFRKPKLPHTDFTICHYAGDVTYQTELFLDKNKDYFFAEHHVLLNASECSLVSGLFPALSDESSKTSKFSSIGSRFKQQLHDLLETLCAIEPHYIRCVKPNNLLKPGIFESKYVLHQLQCGGVMEAIRISCAGYPARKQFYEFVAWFGILAPEVLSGSFDEVTACKKVLEKVGLKGYQIGKTKVFLRAGLMAELDARRNEVLGRLVSIIQRRIRSYLAHRNFILLRLSAIHIQAACKGQLDRKVYESMRREASCLRIQRELQMYVARKAYKELCSSAVAIQTAVRGMTACSEHRFRRQRRAAIIIQAEMEEAKTQENEKLQFALQETQLQFKESKETLMKEHDVAKQAAEQILIVDDVPVIECAMLEKLMSENEELKALVSSLEQKIDETEKKYEETNKISEERLKQALEAESKIIQLKTAMQRPEIFFDLVSENPILWKQALLNSPLKRISEHASTLASQENVDALIRCVMKNIGFSNGKPVAAFTIYKCLLHWKSFEAERTSVFERLIRMIGSAIENQDSNDNLAYWLSNTSVLLFFLQQSLKAAGATNATRHKKPSPPTSLFGRISMGFLSFPSSNLTTARLDVVRQVEAKYPALLFKLQFTAYVEKMYGTIRDNLKKELASLLFLHIQAPRTSKGRLVRSGHSFGKCSPSSHWQSIIECLNALLSALKENFVPPILVQKIFTQVFSFINVQLFNSLLLRRECCTFSNGEYVKAGLADLELWCCQAKEEYADSSWDELKHIRQAVGFLVIRQKYKISYAEITNDLCPILSIQQLYRICSLYRDDINNTRSLPPDVISSMRALIIEDSNNAVNSWFLLDDTSSIPFSVDDLSNSLQEKDFVDVKPAEELLNNPAFQFLHL